MIGIIKLSHYNVFHLIKKSQDTSARNHTNKTGEKSGCATQSLVETKTIHSTTVQNTATPSEPAQTTTTTSSVEEKDTTGSKRSKKGRKETTTSSENAPSIASEFFFMLQYKCCLCYILYYKCV